MYEGKSSMGGLCFDVASLGGFWDVLCKLCGGVKVGYPKKSNLCFFNL